MMIVAGLEDVEVLPNARLGRRGPAAGVSLGPALLRVERRLFSARDRICWAFEHRDVQDLGHLGDLEITAEAQCNRLALAAVEALQRGIELRVRTEPSTPAGTEELDPGRPPRLVAGERRHAAASRCRCCAR